MRNRFKWLHVLMTPMGAYERHGGEPMMRRPRREQPTPVCAHGPDIDLDAAAPPPVLSGGVAAHRIALPRRPAP